MNQAEVLKKKLQLMLPHVRNSTEREILEVIYNSLLEAKSKGEYLDVNMEDLMAHALQEAMILINNIANNEPFPSNAVGSNLWDIRMKPGNDLLGNVSWSVWQTITSNYLIFGRNFNQELAQYYQEFVVKYGLKAGLGIDADKANSSQIKKAASIFKAKMDEIEGNKKASVLIAELLDNVGRIIADNPKLHAQVITALVQDNYDWLGVRDPMAIRAYYWYDYQQNLNPDAWLSPVHHSDIKDRGDYGKQVTLGNSYNDRGFIFWYTVTKDFEALQGINNQWSTDPAKITKHDLRILKENNYIKYSEDIYREILAHLPEN